MLKKIFYSIFATVGVGAMCVGLWFLTWGALSKGWPSTPGRIFSSHIASSHDKTTYSAAVTYEYYINAQRYFSDRVSFGDYSSSGSGHAHEVLSRYPADKIVTIYYNPLKPSMSVLEPGAGGGAFIPLGVGAAFVGFVLFMRMVEKENAELVAKAQAAKADAPVVFEPKELRLPGTTHQRVLVSRNTPRVLTNYPPSAIIMGLVFFAAGLALAGFGGGSQQDGPLLIVLGLFIAVAGGSLAWFAYKGVRLRQLRERASGQSPWLYDFPWDRQGATDGGFKQFIRVLYAISMMSIFLATMQVLMFRHADGPGSSVFLYIIFGLFDIALLIGFGSAAYLFMRAVKYGTNRVLFHSFPLSPGQDIAVSFVADKRLRNQALHAELQCIQEYYESSGSGNSRTSSLVFEQFYAQAGEFRTDGKVANLTFRLPPDARSTDLVGSPPCYWELEITAKVPGIDYRGIFLIPIYCAK